ncbi:MAG TPA: YceI family protein [Gemmatimonadales bacterium]|nr:YceI family protein [Gemmatimonadales bacterium]
MTRLCCMTAALAAVPPCAVSQTAPRRWTVDASLSRAWYLIRPHYGHLYGSTCRADYEEGAADLGGDVQYGIHSGADPRRGLRPPGTGHPCSPAIDAEFAASDTAGWKDLRATIVVQLDYIVGPSKRRDDHMKDQIMKTHLHPQARFTLDSLTRVQPGDTIRAIAVGTFELYGTRRPISAPAVAWFDSTGDLHVNAEFTMPPRALVTDYGVGRLWIGLGWYMWKTLTVGVDLHLKQTRAASGIPQ